MSVAHKFCLFTHSETKDKGLILTVALGHGSVRYLLMSIQRMLSQEFHGKISTRSMRRLWLLRAHKLWCSCESFADSHSPRPGLFHRWYEPVWVKACYPAVPQTIAALRQHRRCRRRRSKGTSRHPHPVLSPHHTLHMWKDLPPNPHRIRQRTQAS